MKQNKEIPAGYKDSPLGIIPEEWEVKKLGSVFSQITTFSFSRDQMSELEQKLRYVHYGDIHKNIERDCINLKIDELPFLLDDIIPDVKMKDSNFPYLINGDILLTDASEDYDGIGKALEIVDTDNKKVIGGLHTIGLRCKTNELVIGFGRLIFKNEQSSKSLKRIAQGTKVYSISYNYIAKLHVIIPPTEEQVKIVEILNCWNEAIEKQEQLVEKLERRKRGLTQQLISARIRIKGFSGSWQTIKMGEVFKRITRKNAELNDNIVTISAQKGFVKQTDFFNKTIASEIIDNYFLIKKGEFCYNKSYSKGYPMGVVKLLSDFDKAVVTTLYICFALKDSDNSVEFFKHYFDSGSLNRELTKIANEGGRAHGLLNVTPSDFFDIHIRIPKVEECSAISEILSNMDKLIDIERKKLQLICSQKRNLMQQLLTGKTRVNI